MIARALVAVAVVVMLAGCATPAPSANELALIREQMAQQTLKIDCPAGCSVEYKDPRDKVVLPRQTNGYDAVIAVGQSVERIVSGAVPVVGMGYMGVEAIKALKGSGPVTTTNTDIGDYSGDYSGSVGDYSGSQSGNAGELVSDNSGSIRSPVDNTHPPTVVEQPAPIVVEQPDPVIINGGGF